MAIFPDTRASLILRIADARDARLYLTGPFSRLTVFPAVVQVLI
jgi:hypothetical protein